MAALNAIFSKLSAEEPVRIRYIATAALINFVDGASKEMLQPVLTEMLQALVTPLQVSPVIVQQQVRVVARTEA